MYLWLYTNETAKWPRFDTKKNSLLLFSCFHFEYLDYFCFTLFQCNAKYAWHTQITSFLSRKRISQANGYSFILFHPISAGYTIYIVFQPHIFLFLLREFSSHRYKHSDVFGTLRIDLGSTRWMSVPIDNTRLVLLLWSFFFLQTNYFLFFIIFNRYIEIIYIFFLYRKFCNSSYVCYVCIYMN